MFSKQNKILIIRLEYLSQLALQFVSVRKLHELDKPDKKGRLHYPAALAMRNLLQKAEYYLILSLPIRRLKM